MCLSAYFLTFPKIARKAKSGNRKVAAADGQKRVEVRASKGEGSSRPEYGFVSRPCNGCAATAGLSNILLPLIGCALRIIFKKD